MSLKKFLIFHIAEMQEVFVLQEFFIFLEYDDTIESFMEIEVDSQYLKAQLFYGKKAKGYWSVGNYKEIVLCLLHEINHMLVAELVDSYPMAKKNNLYQEERVVERNARIWYRLYIQHCKKKGIPL